MRRYGENWRGGKAGIMRHSKRMSIVHEEGGEMLVLEGLSINATPWHTILYLLLLFNDLPFFWKGSFSNFRSPISLWSYSLFENNHRGWNLLLLLRFYYGKGEEGGERKGRE